MACVFTMTDLLGGGPINSGGTWSFQSGPTTNWLLNGVSTVLTAVNGNIGGDTLTIEPVADVTSAGTYVFRYSVGTGPGTCSATADLSITILAGAVVGTNTTLNLCSGDETVYYLGNLLYGGTGLVTTVGNISTDGEWQNSGTTTGDHVTYGYIENTTPGNILNSTFTVSDGVTSVPNGPWLFDYVVDHNIDLPSTPATPDTCDACMKTGTITINITDGANAGDDTQISLCVETTLV